MKRKRIAARLFICNGILFVLTLLYATSFKLSKAVGSDIFACKFLSRVGIYCPACGGSRALLYLLDFKFLKSFLYYPPLLITLFLIIIVDLFALLYVLNGNEKYLKLTRAEIFIIVPFSMLLFFFIRTALLFLGVDYIGDVLTPTLFLF